jgi:hypothetical protein
VWEAFKEGYWNMIGTQSVVDFLDSRKETFATWPLLAVLDLPPFLVNSSTDPLFPCERELDCTRVNRHTEKGRTHISIASKGLDFYTYVSSPGFKVSFAARGNANAEFFESAHTNADGH